MWPWGRQPTTVRIDSLTRRATRAGSLVSARVDGRRIWFESADVELAESAEAFGSLLIVPALHAGRRLVVDPAVDSTWAANVRRIAPLVSRWWGYTPVQPELTQTAVSAARGRGTALCFSGGVDSFFALLRGPRPVDVLVCALGYDVKLRDKRRRALVERSVRAVASELGRRAVVVTSNLRRHGAVRSVPWERSHGGALAALGHVLSREAGRLVIASSHPIVDHHPWGSRWDLDPLFSSARLEIEHLGAEFGRVAKLQSIAGEELVRRHLRVCWENRAASGNCARCEKCVRTMLILESCGQLGRYESFQRGWGLLESLDRVAAVTYPTSRVYEALLAAGLSEPYRAGVQRLLSRSGGAIPSPAPPAGDSVQE